MYMYCLKAVNDNKEASKAILEILHRGWICTALTRSIQKYKISKKIHREIQNIYLEIQKQAVGGSALH